MRNRILCITRTTIPYVKELRPIAGSVTACIVMQQLDYWFDRYPKGFYKFLSPCDHDACKPGASWSEELGVSADEFRVAFDKIGTRYGSRTAFESEPGDKFAGKFYCSYHDKNKGLTYYFRNHAAVDLALDSLVSEEGGSHLRNGDIPFTELDNSIYVTPEIHLDIRKAETTAYITAKTTKRESKNIRLPDTVLNPSDSPSPFSEDKPIPAAKKRRAVKTEPVILSAAQQAQFDKFWDRYPNAVGKQDAIKAWAKLNPDHALLCIMAAGLKTWEASARWADAVYQNPATWLNGRAWEDSPAPVKSQAPKLTATEQRVAEGRAQVEALAAIGKKVRESKQQGQNGGTLGIINHEHNQTTDSVKAIESGGAGGNSGALLAHLLGTIGHKEPDGQGANGCVRYGVVHDGTPMADDTGTGAGYTDADSPGL